MGRGRARNPYAPGAGTRPPELVGRNREIDHARLLLTRLSAGRPEKSMIITGQRGVGKTVLLNHFQDLALEDDPDPDFARPQWHVEFFEVSHGTHLQGVITRMARRVLLRLSLRERGKARVLQAMRALKSFTISLPGDVDITIDGEALPGTADSGVLEEDLRDLLLEIGEAAKAADTGVLFLLDEAQFLSKTDYEALIVALHRVSQRTLPIAVIAAGLPLLPRLTGQAKTYAERLFDYATIGALSPDDACAALAGPAAAEGVEFEHDALTELLRLTDRYPYFLQEYGKHVWQVADTSPITLAQVHTAAPVVQAYLDEGFFSVRVGRLTPRQQRYMAALGALGDGPQSSAAVATRAGYSSMTQASKIRDELIKAALLYAPQRGTIDFTVPHCASYVRRHFTDSAPAP